MKKVICFIFIIFTVILCSCSSDTDNWKTICIENCGTMKIPNNWTFFIENDIMYIMDGKNPVMISCERTGKKESNLYFTDYQYIDFISSAVLSNDPIYGKAKYLYKGEEIERYYLNLGETIHDEEIVEFVVWEQKMSEETLIKIAKTFITDAIN